MLKKDEEPTIRLDAVLNELHKEEKWAQMTSIRGFVSAEASFKPSDIDEITGRPIQTGHKKTMSYLVKVGPVTFDIQIPMDRRKKVMEILEGDDGE